MFSLHLTCDAKEMESLSFALWESGTAGIREDECELIAGFEDEAKRDELLARFAKYQPRWVREDDTDWVAATEESWPGREVGKCIFLAPVWNSSETPTGNSGQVNQS